MKFTTRELNIAIQVFKKTGNVKGTNLFQKHLNLAMAMKQSEIEIPDLGNADIEAELHNIKFTTKKLLEAERLGIGVNGKKIRG